MPELSVDLIQYKEIQTWKPRVGDVLIEDGIFFRTWNVVTEAKGQSIKCFSAGLLRLICIHRYKEKLYNLETVKSSSPGLYTVIQDGVFYV